MPANTDPPTLEDDVRLLLAANATDEAKNQAAKRLSTEIQLIARGVARWGTRGERDDFVDSAPALLLALDGPRIIHFDAHKASFRTWAGVCLRNAWISQYRRSATKKLGTLHELSTLASADESLIWCKLGDLSTTVTADDLSEMKAWPMKVFLVLVFRGGLWQKVPQEILKNRVSDAATKLNFSPEAFFNTISTWDPYEPSANRNEPLANALGWRGNHVALIWKREHARLDRLQFVRDIKPPS